MLLQQHRKGATYVVALPPSTPAPVRPPSAPPGQGPDPDRAATRPQRSRAADRGLRRAALKLGIVAGAPQRAPPPKDGGLGGEGGASLDSGTPLERSDDSDDAHALSSGAYLGLAATQCARKSLASMTLGLANSPLAIYLDCVRKPR